MHRGEAKHPSLAQRPVPTASRTAPPLQRMSRGASTVSPLKLAWLSPLSDL